VNAGASRLYYAMFQAALHRFAALGIRPALVRSGADRWDHATVANNVRMLRGRQADRPLYGDILRLRVRADYAEGPVDAWEIEWYRASIREFVQEMTA